MKIRVLFSFLFLFLILQPMTGQAFVPQAPHLFYLVVQKIKQPSGLKISQKRTVLTYDSVDVQDVALSEELKYQFPNQLRADLKSDVSTSFTVESGLNFIKVVNGETISREKTALDLYTDVLLYRDHEGLSEQLLLAGIDIEQVSIQRYEETICYVVGQERKTDSPAAGLWVDKESFFPLKYAVEKNEWLVECFYENWQRISRTWYPMQVRIFLDNQLFATISVVDIALKSGFPDSLFDIGQLHQIYPGKLDLVFPEDEIKEESELDKRIEEFKKLYE